MWKTIPQKDKRTWKRLAKQRRTAAEEGWGHGLWEFNGKSKSKSRELLGDDSSVVVVGGGMDMDMSGGLDQRAKKRFRAVL